MVFCIGRGVRVGAWPVSRADAGPFCFRSFSDTRRASEATVAEARGTIHICVTCAREGATTQTRAGKILYESVASRAMETQAPYRIIPVECMANCRRGCTVAFAAPGKWTYILGEIDPTTPNIADALLACAELQTANAQGIISYFARPGILRKGTVARVPPPEGVS